ncbi:MAG TPA: D-ribose ABC transporter substrate-binding protein [Trueperaceae bacterium]|nr:D-ribose ABC transporter substrate-binding protein [Trueperaceae bacterium]
MKNFKGFLLAGIVLILAMGIFASAQDVTIGYSISTLNNAFFVGMTKGVEQGGENMGVKILTVNANGDSAKQAADVEDLITKKVDAIIINPRDAEAIAPSVQKALDAGIPVFALDRGVTGVELTGFLETDNIAMGRLAADLIAEALFEKYGKVEGEVIELGGLVGTTAARDREQGFHERLESYPGINLVASQPADFNQEKAYNVTTNLMLANPNVDAIYGHNDDNTVGAARALKAMGKLVPAGKDGHIYIVGIDGIQQALDLIRAGSIDATISQEPVIMGEKAVEFAIAYLNGESFPSHFFTDFTAVEGYNIDHRSNWAE